jgi:bifunctional DNA-binding transcriptional regulator/antitoxin component of YhaV-PrlF toxin-antitoxin module
VEEDAVNGEYFITFPDDLLEAANLKEGDDVEWIDKKRYFYSAKN